MSRGILADVMFREPHGKVLGLDHVDDAISVPEIRNGEEQKAIGLEHARNLLDDSTIVGNVLCGLGTDGSVKGGIAIRHPGRIGLSEFHVTRSGLR